MALLERRARITLIQPELQEGPSRGELSHVSRPIERGEALGEEIVGQCFDGRGRLRTGVISASIGVAP